MAGWLILAVILFVISAVLVVAEILIPSFGLLTIASLSCLAGGIAIFYNYQLLTAGIITAAIIIPITLMIAYKKFPSSKMGKSVFLARDPETPGHGVPDCDRIEALTGKEGVALSTMRPVGRCEIDGNKYECVAESGYVKKDTPVKVIEVQGSQITVRKIETEDK